MMVLQGIAAGTTTAGTNATLEIDSSFLARFTVADRLLISVTGITVGGTSFPGLIPHLIIDNNEVVIEPNYRSRVSFITATPEVILTTYTYIDDDNIHRTVYPADRCTWRQHVPTASQRGYGVANVQFYPGNATAIDVANAQLGYIGKSGRFVEIAE